MTSSVPQGIQNYARKYTKVYARSDTYAEGFVGAEDGATLWVHHDLQLLHSFGTSCEQRGEHFFELITDGQWLSLKRDFSVLDIRDANGCAGDKLVAQPLKLGEGSTQGGGLAMLRSGSAVGTL